MLDVGDFQPLSKSNKYIASSLRAEASPRAMRATNVKTFPKTFLSFLAGLNRERNSETYDWTSLQDDPK